WCNAWGLVWTVLPRRGKDLRRVSASKPRCSAVNCSKWRTLRNRLRYWAQYWSIKATVGVAGRTRVMATPPSRRPHPAYGVPNMTDEGSASFLNSGTDDAGEEG